MKLWHKLRDTPAWSREAGYEVLDTSPAAMVCINDGTLIYPLEPLGWLADYASNRDQWIVQKRGQGRFAKTWAEPEELQRVVAESVAALAALDRSTGILAIRPKDMNLGVVAMAIVTAKTSAESDVSREIPDNTFFGVTLLEVNRVASSDQYKRDKTEGAPPEWRLMFKWITEDGTDNWVFDATSTLLGESKAQVAYLRQLINAIHGRKPGAPVAWFDETNLFYGLDAEFTGDDNDEANVKAQASGQLTAGIRIQVMGVSSTKVGTDGVSRNKFKVKAYKQAEGTASAKADPTPAPVAATASSPSTAPTTTPTAAGTVASADVDF